MARPIWTGSVAFGLVNVPVAVYTATEDKTVHFNQFADEVRDPRDEIEDLPDAGAFRGKELTIAKQLIDSMTIEWRPENYQDPYREGVEDLIERKRRGEEIITETAPPEDSGVVDLADALRRSAEMQRRRSAGGKSTAGAPAKRGGGARSAGRRAAGGGTNRTRSSGKSGAKAKSSPKRKAS